MLKKYWIYILCFLLCGTTFYFYNKSQAAFAEMAAQKAKNKILAQADKEKAERIAYWQKLYDAEAEKRKDAEMGEDIAVVTANINLEDLKAAQAEIAKIKECPDQVIALNFTLTQCRNQYAQTVADMGIAFDNLKLSCDKTIGDMTKNIGESEAAVTKYSDLYADMTAKHIRYVAKQRRGKLLWVGAGVALGILFKSL